MEITDNSTELGGSFELKRANNLVHRLLKEIFLTTGTIVDDFYQQPSMGSVRILGPKICFRMMNRSHRCMVANAVFPALLDLNDKPDSVIENVRNAVLYANDDMDLALAFTPYLKPASEIECNFEQATDRIRGLVSTCHEEICRNCRMERNTEMVSLAVLRSFWKQIAIDIIGRLCK